MLNQVRIVLVNPSHPGNIGASARAMKNMGLSSLYLVAPEQFPNQQATVRASGADEILANAMVVSTLSEAVSDCRLVFATSARVRSLPWPTCTPRECAKKAMESNQSPIALVFGCEASGLSNEALAICHYHVHIPTVENFSSLNLAAAVQILTYEFFMAATEKPSIKLGQDDKTQIDHDTDQIDSRLATTEEVAGFLKQLELLLVAVQFLDPSHPKLLLQRLQRLFNRAQLEEKEIHILRGILSTIEKRLLVL